MNASGCGPLHDERRSGHVLEKHPDSGELLVVGSFVVL
jgi:hypothetical protein